MGDITEEYEIDAEACAEGNPSALVSRDSYGNAKGIAAVYRSPVTEVEHYLTSYRLLCRMIEMNRYERSFFASSGRTREDPLEESEAYLQARMYEIREFILSIGECDEKLFLYYYYVHGESVDRCAELLAVSRSTAYRLRKSALVLAARYYAEKRPIAL